MAPSWRSLSRLSRKELKDLQDRKLRRFINGKIYPFSSFYRELFNKCKIGSDRIRSSDDLKRLPFTVKQDLISGVNPNEQFREFILKPDKEKIKKYSPKLDLIKLSLASVVLGKEKIESRLRREFQPVFITFTTGTTDRPVPFVYSHHDLANLYLSGTRMLELFGMQATERAVNLFPYAPHLAFWQVVFGGFSSDVLILSTGGGKVMSSDASLGALLKIRPSVVLGVPSYVYHLLRMAKEKDLDLSFINKIVLGAARISEPYKVRLRKFLSNMGAKDVSIFGTYGFTESRTAWVECPSPSGISSGYHLYPDKEIFEVIDPVTGEVKGEGEDGELVYTPLDSRGSVVLRYRTGDFVKGGISYDPCPCCGLTVPRISSDITRLSDVRDIKLSKIKGTLVDLNHFTSVLCEYDCINEWQIEIRKKDNDPFEIDEVIIYLNVKDGVNREVFADEIKKKILMTTEVSPNEVIFFALEDMIKRLELETATKDKRIVDSRPKT